VNGETDELFELKLSLLSLSPHTEAVHYSIFFTSFEVSALATHV
jgi:hypothetical protein